MKYPYIGEGRRGSIVLFSADSSGFAISHENKTLKGKYTNHWDERAFTDITHEYLQNTYGEVVSPEHAEFIIDLCLGSSISFAVNNARRKYFAINGGKLYFFYIEIDASNVGSKKITIPLPPKFNKTSEILNPSNADVKFSNTEPLKNAGDNLILGCEESKCDEWPQVNDKAEYGNGVIVTIIATDGEYAWVSCRPSDREKPCTVRISELQKPKTPEEELRDWMHERIGYGIASGFDCEQITHDLLHHLNITKKPQ